MEINEKNDDLIINNQNLIYKAIKKLDCVYRTEDEFQEFYDAGLDGLIKGAKLYDESKGKPSTWLMPCIMNEIKHYFVNSNAKKRKNQFGRDISLFQKVYKDDSGISYEDIICDPNVNIEEDFETRLFKQQKMKLLKTIISIFDEKDRFMLEHYFGLWGKKKLNQKEIAKKLNTNQPLISYRIRKLMRIIKKIMEDKYGKEN